MKEKRIIAVTGGIGSGKSTALKYISELGYTVVSCDEEIKKMYSEREIVEGIRKLFPSSFVSGKIDKQTVAKIVFEDKKELEKLNAFLHPLVMKRCFDLAKEDNGKGISFIEVPLLFESNLQDRFDGVIVIKRNVDLRIESVMKRSGLSREEVERRINNQFDYDKNDLSKYYLVENTYPKQDIKEKIIKIIDKIV